MQNRRGIATASRHRWVGVQRIGIAGQTVEQCLRRQGGFFVDDIALTGRRWQFHSRASLAAEAADAANENGYARASQFFTRFCGALDRKYNQCATALVVDFRDAQA